MKTNKKINSILILILTDIMWGSSFAVVKDDLSYISPIWQLALRAGIACVFAIPMLIINLKKSSRKTLWHGIVLGGFFFLALIFQNIGLQYVSASKSAFLCVSYVIFIPIIERFVIKKKISKLKAIACVICMAGVGILTLNANLIIEKGDIVILISSVMYAAHIVCIGSLCKDDNEICIHSLQIMTVTVFAFAAAVIFEPIPVSVPLKAWDGIVYCGIFEMFLGFLLQIVGQKNLSSTLSGILLSMESVFGCIFAVILLGDTFTTRIIIGSVIIVISAILDSVSDSPNCICNIAKFSIK